MNKVVRQMVKTYKIKKLKYDFAGYYFINTKELSFHHLLVPSRLDGDYKPYNGVILKQSTSHDYMHLIEKVDPELYDLITLELYKENINGITLENIKRIRDVFLYFESNYSSLLDKNGKSLIKEKYISERVKL